MNKILRYAIVIILTTVVFISGYILGTRIRELENQGLNNAQNTSELDTKTNMDNNTTSSNSEMINNQTDTTASNSYKYSAENFVLDFTIDQNLGDILSVSSDSQSNGVSFCLTENITFSESGITMKLIKGSMECAGATGGIIENEEKILAKDNKEFTISTIIENSSRVRLYGTYGSNSDMNRNVQIYFESAGRQEIDDAKELIKDIIRNLSYDENTLRSEVADEVKFY